MNALRTIPNRASLIGLRFSSTQTHSAANAAGNDAGKAVTEVGFGMEKLRTHVLTAIRVSGENTHRTRSGE